MGEVTAGSELSRVNGRRDRCSALREAAVRLLGAERVWGDAVTTRLHSYDASLEQGQPDLVACPHDRDELCALVSLANVHDVPFVLRGAGTGYSGGALAVSGGMVVLTSGLDRILATDFDEGWVRVEPGVVLAAVQRLSARNGWLYVPDPSSHQVCTIGGNVAENAGGPHALGGGPTSNYVIAVEFVRPDGSLLTLDEQQPWDGGLDLRALVVGSEGTLGAVASTTLRLVREPEVERILVGAFADKDDALGAITEMFQDGLLPSALDMLTGAFVPGFSQFTDPSLLFIGLRGRAEEVRDQEARVSRHTRRHRGTEELLEVPEFLARRAELVRDKVRRMVQVSGCPRYYLFDAVAPRSALPELMDAIRAAAAEFDLPVLNTFHAGDGNVHPAPFYRPEEPGHRERLLAFSSAVLKECRYLGGALSGEHGIGLEKRELMTEFIPADALRVMAEVKRAFDPAGLCNPGKVLPDTPTPAGSVPRVRSQRPRGPAVEVDALEALIVIADPSVTFRDAADALAGTPYELPFEPLGADPHTSVLSAVDAGMPALREDVPVRVRDLLVGAILRQPDAGYLELGGRCAKDVAGYELRKLVFGGRGRLGRLSQVTMRVLPRPTAARLARGPVTERTAAFDLRRRVQAAWLPFAYLGVLVYPDGMGAVTGRLEVRGGGLLRHLDLLQAIDPTAIWRWEDCTPYEDPVMHALAGPGALCSAAGAAASQVRVLRAGPARALFASTTHRRTFWRASRTLQSDNHSSPRWSRRSGAASHDAHRRALGPAEVHRLWSLSGDLPDLRVEPCRGRLAPRAGPADGLAAGRRPGGPCDGSTPVRLSGVQRLPRRLPDRRTGG